MTDDAKREAEARAEITKATAKFKRAERAREQAREDLKEVLVRCLTERILPPGEVAKLSPYDRVHVNRLAREAGVPPARKRTVRSIREQPSDETGNADT